MAVQKQRIRGEEIEIEVVERKKLIEIEEKEIMRKEKELKGTIMLPAESEAYRMEQLATGQRSVFTLPLTLTLISLDPIPNTNLNTNPNANFNLNPNYKPISMCIERRRWKWRVLRQRRSS